MVIEMLKDKMNKGELVLQEVEEPFRIANAKLHSAGHLIDVAVKALKYGWIPTKGYHFSDGPYVEYSGNFTNFDFNKSKNDIEIEC
jgi:Ser-tRNA(Ala) deacylase AlaX